MHPFTKTRIEVSYVLINTVCKILTENSSLYFTILDESIQKEIRIAKESLFIALDGISKKRNEINENS